MAELFEDKNFFSLLVDNKTLSFGEFDESKTHLFLIHFSNMFLTILDLLLCQIMEYVPTLCFASVI